MKPNLKRLATGGRIDRSAPVDFSFDGHPLKGYAGDTLASALLAADISLVARSFKYHRPRGIYSAGPEEPNALVSLGHGGRHEPNCLATTTTLVEGLRATSQNCWPSLSLDLMSINNFLSPVFSAGFYYKTFMGPTRRAWMFYEHIIRRAAGMGRSSLETDPDRYEKANDFCDVLVIGAGPTGMVAALSAAENGARVILVEQQTELGGHLLSEDKNSPAETWRSNHLGKLVAHPNVRILTVTTAFGAYDHNTFGLVERLDDDFSPVLEFSPRQRLWKIRTKRTLLATGMYERPPVFNNNDLPGVMLASAVRTYINRYAVLPGNNAVIFTNNDTAYETAISLAAAGARVKILDARITIPEACLQVVEKTDITVYSGCAITRAHGRKHITSVYFLSQGNRVVKKLNCDLLAVSAGWTPTLHLWSQRGRKPVYDEQSCCFLPDGIIDGIECVGDCAGRFNRPEAIDHAIEAGFRAARDGIGQSKLKPAPRGKKNNITALAHRPGKHWFDTITPLWSSHAPGELNSKKAFVDLQHDVTESDIQLAHREGYSSVEHLKRYTTQGMAADQGKTSNVNALALMAAQRGQAIQQVGTTTFRPPFTPVAIGVFAGSEHGSHYQPSRLSPIHSWHCEQNAPQIQAGLWQRAWYYPKTGETLDTAYRREASHVRKSVGLVDVSSLGKILVQGPDSAEFMNRVYTNNWDTLKVGRVRYGVMLRDDGIILDDGTTARLSDNEFFMTTTTANASRVMSHMEFLLQTSWQHLKVRVTSVSDQWAGMALAGPLSRQVLKNAVIDCDVSTESLPHMGLVYGEIDGAPVRIHRMSFSGELAYEIFTPSGYGLSVWRAIILAGKEMNIQPYGNEALGALRIEKGHVAGAELDGRTTLSDLGLEGLASRKKTYVGKTLSKRPIISAPERPRIVGLETINSADRIRSGSILFSKSKAKKGHGEGHVTSTTYSVHLDKNIALGLLSNGEQRLGEIIVCCNPVEGQEIEIKVTSPHFYDPTGERLNG